jgi:hypothetical protein
VIRQFGWTSDRETAIGVAVDLDRYGAESYWGRGWKGGRRRWPGILLPCDTRSICMLLRGIWSFSPSLCVYLLSDINDVLYVHPLSTVGPVQINANAVFYCSFAVIPGSILIHVGNIRRWARTESEFFPSDLVQFIIIIIIIMFMCYVILSYYVLCVFLFSFIFVCLLLLN